MSAPQTVAQPLSIAFASDQIHWLTAEARVRRISRSALVRQAVDLLITRSQATSQPSDA